VAGAVNLPAYLKCPDRLWGPPVSYLVGTVGCFPGGRAAGTSC